MFHGIWIINNRLAAVLGEADIKATAFDFQSQKTFLRSCSRHEISWDWPLFHMLRVLFSSITLKGRNT
jgi:hypothetical protein